MRRSKPRMIPFFKSVSLTAHPLGHGCLSWLLFSSCLWCKFHALVRNPSKNSIDAKTCAYSICQLVIAAVPISDSPSASNFFSNFLSVIIFLVMWAGYKIIFWKHCKTKKPEDIDLMTGRRENDPEEQAKLEWYAALPRHKRLATYVGF